MINFKKNIILENSRVRLLPLQIKHIDYVAPIVLKTPDLLKYSPPRFGTVELLAEYIAKNISLREKELKYPFIIFDKSVQEFAGCSSFMNVSLENQRLEIGSTWIGTDFQRTGLNRNCKYLLLSYAFEELGMERIELKTDARNLQSQQAIKGIGAQYEGRLRSHTLMSDGFRRDTVFFSILKAEWPRIKSSIFAEIED